MIIIINRWGWGNESTVHLIGTDNNNWKQFFSGDKKKLNETPHFERTQQKKNSIVEQMELFRETVDNNNSTLIQLTSSFATWMHNDDENPPNLKNSSICMPIAKWIILLLFFGWVLFVIMHSYLMPFNEMHAHSYRKINGLFIIVQFFFHRIAPASSSIIIETNNSNWMLQFCTNSKN